LGLETSLDDDHAVERKISTEVEVARHEQNALAESAGLDVGVTVHKDDWEVIFARMP